jgi:hypothetical protein
MVSPDQIGENVSPQKGEHFRRSWCGSITFSETTGNPDVEPRNVQKLDRTQTGELGGDYDLSFRIRSVPNQVNGSAVTPGFYETRPRSEREP